MIIKKTMVARHVAGETILVPFGDAYVDNTGLFALTEVGAFIWEILPECETTDEIVSKILEEYEVTMEQAKSDVEVFLDKLRSFDIID